MCMLLFLCACLLLQSTVLVVLVSSTLVELSQKMSLTRGGFTIAAILSAPFVTKSDGKFFGTKVKRDSLFRNMCFYSGIQQHSVYSMYISTCWDCVRNVQQQQVLLAWQLLPFALTEHFSQRCTLELLCAYLRSYFWSKLRSLCFQL